MPDDFLESINEYCRKYRIPVEYFMDILEDQKVIPMIRGKVTEYNAFLRLKAILNRREWDVSKLNLNAQNGIHDEDVTITHQRTGIIIKVECKNAVRSSMKYSNRCRFSHEPFCTIKCHKSRSDLSRASTTNDRYLLGEFDVIVTNLSNAVIASATFTQNFELIDKPDVIRKLAEHYNCTTSYEDIFNATYEDWRFCMANDIAEDGVIPRTPGVLLENDVHWRSLDSIEESLESFVRANHNRMGRR